MSHTHTTLLFATRNRGKLTELKELLANVSGLRLVCLDDVDVPDVVEDGDTFAANATKKALEVSRACGLPALADDSGLEVDALGGAPGVYSARYAGELATDADNNAKLLRALEGVPAAKRTARFKSVLALADVSGQLGSKVICESGSCEGRILVTGQGDGGFGYDPLFYVDAHHATFAELGIGTKNDSSHRAQAMRAMRPHILRYFRLGS